jgi:hypothetical protein
VTGDSYSLVDMQSGAVADDLAFVGIPVNDASSLFSERLPVCELAKKVKKYRKVRPIEVTKVRTAKRYKKKSNKRRRWFDRSAVV